MWRLPSSFAGLQVSYGKISTETIKDIRDTFTHVPVRKQKGKQQSAPFTQFRGVSASAMA